MTNVAYATLPVIPSFDNFSGEFNKQVRNPLVAAGTDAGSAAGNAIANGAKKALAGIAIGAGAALAGAGAIAAKGLDRALNIQDAKAQLTGLGHDAASVSTIMESALASVKGTAFGLDQSATIAASAVAAGIAPGEALTRTLKLTADSATIAKVPLSEMGGIINKVATNQKLTTETMQQFQDRGIPILQAVANQYGVTSDVAAEMVSKGQVDFATFQNALESSVGGAALSSGTTARGAFDNVGAAFGRMGAMFVQPAVDGAPTLFQAIAGAVDRGTTALKPFATELGARLTPAIASFAGWINNIDFNNIGASFGGLADTGSQLRNILVFLNPFGPALQGIGSAIADVSGSLGDVLGNALRASTPLLDAFSGFLGFLADNGQLVVPIILALVGAVALYRASQIASNFADLASIPVAVARTGAILALAVATRAQTVATQGSVAATEASVVANNASQLAQIRLQAAWLVSKGAQLASAVATGVATAAQWAWNAAMSANPIGIIILAIAALVAAIIWVATQTTFFQDAWTAVTTAIGVAWNWLWNTVLQPVFNAIGAIFNWIYNTIIVPIVTGIMIYVGIWAAIFTWLWNSVLSPVFQAIGAIFNWIYNNIIMPIVIGILIYVGIWAAIFTWLWDTVLSPIFAAIGAIFEWVWNSIIMPVVNFIVAYIQFWANTILWLWNTVISVVFAAIGAIFQWVWDSVIQPVINFIQLAIAALGATASWLWDNAINPAISAIGGAFNWLWNSVISPTATFINNAVSLIGSTVNTVFSGIATFIGDAFATALDLVRGPINGIISLVNGAIGAINSISVTIPAWVPIVGGQTFSANIPSIPSLAQGANIMARPGGTLAILGEAGRAETVTDLGDTNRLIRTTTALAEKSDGGGDRVNFYGDVTTADPDELADKINHKKKKARMANGGKVNVG